MDNDILSIETDKFFNIYWNIENGEYPKWSSPWYFNGEIPNQKKGGCYALYFEDELVYIGSGVSKGYGIYENCGLGHRLNHYWKVNKSLIKNSEYLPVSNWIGLTSLKTIGFKPGHVFLSLALEAYLIFKLKPIINLRHK